MINKNHGFLIYLFAFLIISCNPQVGGNKILDENFDDNTIGWYEERTNAHYLNVHKGKYFIESKDTAVNRTSTASLYKNYLLNLPDRYTITSSMRFTADSVKETHFGILLMSPTLEYNFAVYSNGWVLASEYGYNLDTINTLCSKHINLNPRDFSKLEVKINKMEFKLMVNNTEIGSGQFKAETNSWGDMRLYTSKASGTMIDYIRIVKD